MTIVSCEFFTNQEQPDAVAQLGDAYLTRAEILSILPADYTTADSVLIVQKYIDDWTTDQMLLRNARKNITQDKQDDLQLLIKKYQMELYTQAYLQELVKANLDTTFSKSTIEQYFQERKEEFKLNEELVKFRYISLDASYPDVEEIYKLFKRNDLKSVKALDSLSLGYRNYSLNDDVWVNRGTVLERISPITAANAADYLKPGSNWKLEDSLGVYLVHVKDVLKRGEQAPLSYVQPTIKQILRNQRKLTYIKNLEKELLDDAIQNKRLKVNP
ncbi:peptidyl-prolyl cis-trans isomerase [Nonlabens ponticola]|uniref:Peptidyl-prolyl cis-trans isomerase n=1 Tax=Nonlabens ponticola TaxID=2496866 RepID=A0A3S9N1X9_9FLAO|nr:peptidyl-prolyl cis-trans isomerase [Nonlabens ponticola]